MSFANRMKFRVESSLRACILLGVSLLLLIAGALAVSPAWGQRTAGAAPHAMQPSDQSATAKVAAPDAVSAQGRFDLWEGKPVLRIEFIGVPTTRLDPLPSQLAQQPGTLLAADQVRESLRRLYATGLYDSIAVEGSLETGGVVLRFSGQPRTFIGIVSVEGAKGANTNALLARASRLTPGTRFTTSSLAQAETAIRKSLAEAGFHEPVLNYKLTQHPENQLVDIAYTVVSGPQARTGGVEVSGESGLTPEEFRHYSKLRPGKKIDRETNGQALDGVVNHYRKEDRLEADVKLQSQVYDLARKVEDFRFSANRGPLVHVLVDGVNLRQDRVKKLVPIYEEGTVDEDLLNEGDRRLENYYQRLGFFDVKVSHEQKPASLLPTTAQVEIVFHVKRGARHRVEMVSVAGARYFDQPTLLERLSVRKHDSFDPDGIYNQSLVSSDVAALEAIYHNNGFSTVKVTPEIQDADASGRTPVNAKRVALNVVYHIEEGEQLRVHSVTLQGAEKVLSVPLEAMMNTAAGQPLSPENLAGDRDTLLTYYLSRGFDQATVEVRTSEIAAAPREASDKSAADAEDLTATPKGKHADKNPDKESEKDREKRAAADSAQVDVTFRIVEGEQVFLRRVLITGLHYTKYNTIAHGITMKEGQPLDATALLDTQRNLYDLALFNEVNPVIQNPTGQEPHKTVLLQTTEARRWDLSYGAGFELQTGTVNGANNSNPNGTVGASPRVVLQVSRINLFGHDQTASLRGNYGLLEQRISLVYQYPHILGNRNLSFSFTAGYNNSQDVVTYSASQLEGSLRLTEKFNGEHELLSKANTFIYQFVYRRVKVDENSVQLPQDEIPLLLEAVRVGGPSFTWIRDTRDAPLDAHRGTYTSFQEFISSAIFDSQANFNQVDVSNSSYYRFNHDRFVLARNTRFGQERAYGKPVDEEIPLPERLYGGGGSSHRGFGVNSAGPRDPLSGFPIGGAGAFVNSTELRLPPPTLPYVGNSVSFVLFHDMGNVFTNSRDIWPSFGRFRQQDRAGCRDLSYNINNPPVGPVTSTGTQGPCSFNYFSHALGLGLRYHTPVGPVRIDFSWNLNPPIYPVTYNTVTDTNLAKPYVGEGAHFNFFFSLGQSF